MVPKEKWPGREAEHSPPSSAEVKNGEAVPPFLHKPSWSGIYFSTGTVFYLRNYWVFGLCPSSNIVKNTQRKNVSETRSVSIIR
jgi:hypothetical protein